MGQLDEAVHRRVGLYSSRACVCANRDGRTSETNMAKIGNSQNGWSISYKKEIFSIPPLATRRKRQPEILKVEEDLFLV